ncbi:MAG: hypothetical protein Q4F71_09260 [Paracoccus sp. (in: a-proteobacteria)]|nr:hypothetical protein [Paracoccus sp. (in: a-proteobacteria)]
MFAQSSEAYLIISGLLGVAGIVAALALAPWRQTRLALIWAGAVVVFLFIVVKGNLMMGAIPMMIAYGSVPAIFMSILARQLPPRAQIVGVALLAGFAALGYWLMGARPETGFLADLSYVLAIWLHAIPIAGGFAAGVLLSRRERGGSGA